MKLLMLLVLVFSLPLAQAKNWELILDDDKIKVFTDKNKAGIMPFMAKSKIESNYTDLKDILLNYEHKHKWAPKLKAVKIHKKISDTEYIFSEYYSTPWPTTDREFLLHGKIIEQGNKVIFKAKSIDKKEYMDEDHVQANVENIEVVLTKVDEQSTDISFEFVGDMNGWIPNWLMTLIQKKWPFKFIKGLREEGPKRKRVLASTN